VQLRRTLTAIALTTAAAGLVPLLSAAPAQASPGGTIDFNDDGASDYAIGAPGENVNNRPDAGAVYVSYGTPSTNNAKPHVAPAPRLTQDSPGTRAGAEVGDEFGAAIETGNFNDDSYTDLVVGSPGEDIGTAADTGGITVFYGSASGLQAAGGFSQANLPGGANGSGDEFGFALASGDFDGVTGDDLAVGAPGKTVAASHDAGAAYAIYSGGVAVAGARPNAVTPGEGLNAANALTINQNVGNLPGSAEVNDGFGRALAGGQANGGGPDDLVIGVPGEDITVESTNHADTGELVLLLGQSDEGLDTSTPSAIDGTDLPTTDDNSNDITVKSLGTAIAIGAVQQGVVIGGAPDSTVDPGDDAQPGAGVIAEIPIVTGAFFPTNSELYDQNSQGFPGGSEAGDGFGASLAAGDWTGDEEDDYAIGIPGESLGSAENAGAVEIWNSDAPAQFLSQNSPPVPGVAEAGDLFGLAVSAGDFDDDGTIDLGVGVPGETPRSTPEGAGIVQLFPGNGSTGIPGTGSVARSAPQFGTPYHQDAAFGASLVIGHGGTSVTALGTR
jgi:hypothetical protein